MNYDSFLDDPDDDLPTRDVARMAKYEPPKPHTTEVWFDSSLLIETIWFPSDSAYRHAEIYDEICLIAWRAGSK